MKQFFIGKVGMKILDFFEGRNELWRFQDVVDYIHSHFIKTPHVFGVGEKVNTVDENQRKCAVLAYAIGMKYKFEQVKALMSEHDHFAIAILESRKDRNI